MVDGALTAAGGSMIALDVQTTGVPIFVNDVFGEVTPTYLWSRWVSFPHKKYKHANMSPDATLPVCG